MCILKPGDIVISEGQLMTTNICGLVTLNQSLSISVYQPLTGKMRRYFLSLMQFSRIAR